jgi:hypothetical protein
MGTTGGARAGESVKGIFRHGLRGGNPRDSTKAA